MSQSRIRGCDGKNQNRIFAKNTVQTGGCDDVILPFLIILLSAPRCCDIQPLSHRHNANKLSYLMMTWRWYCYFFHSLRRKNPQIEYKWSESILLKLLSQHHNSSEGCNDCQHRSSVSNFVLLSERTNHFEPSRSGVTWSVGDRNLNEAIAVHSNRHFTINRLPCGEGAHFSDPEKPFDSFHYALPFMRRTDQIAHVSSYFGQRKYLLAAYRWAALSFLESGRIFDVRPETTHTIQSDQLRTADVNFPFLLFSGLQMSSATHLQQLYFVLTAKQQYVRCTLCDALDSFRRSESERKMKCVNQTEWKQTCAVCVYSVLCKYIIASYCR